MFTHQVNLKKKTEHVVPLLKLDNTVAMMRKHSESAIIFCHVGFLLFVDFHGVFLFL